MRLVGLVALQEFAKRHADVRPQINAWVSEAKDAIWRGPADVKARYPTASVLRDNHVVFNLKGNKYRLDTKIHYETQIVVVLRVGTHAEYSKWEF